MEKQWSKKKLLTVKSFVLCSLSCLINSCSTLHHSYSMVRVEKFWNFLGFFDVVKNSKHWTKRILRTSKNIKIGEACKKHIAEALQSPYPGGEAPISSVNRPLQQLLFNDTNKLSVDIFFSSSTPSRRTSSSSSSSAHPIPISKSAQIRRQRTERNSPRA